MPAININNFRAAFPKITPRLLETNQAVKAINCELSRGHLEALKAPLLIHDLDNSASTIFKHNVLGWLSFKQSVSIVKSAIAEVEENLGHIFTTGEDWPAQYLADGTRCRLGLPRPTQAPQLKVDSIVDNKDNTTVWGVGADSIADFPPRYGIDKLPNVEGDNIVLYADSLIDADNELDSNVESPIMRSTAYCYTVVRSLAKGIIQQESAPSPPSEVVDVEEGQEVTISGFTFENSLELGISHIRLYRTVSGLESSEFRFLAELAASDTEYIDSIHDKDISPEVLRTSLWDNIPDKAKGLIKTDNGLYACFQGNELLISEPFVPYAWPQAYRLTVEDEIVALGQMDNTIVILTKGRPYLAVGSVPESLQLVHLPIEQACISPHSVAMLPGGVIYASPDGLMLFSSGEQSLLSASVWSREQWQSMQPERLMGAVHDGRYIGFFKGSNHGFIYTVASREVVSLEFSASWQIKSLYHHSQDDALYISITDNNRHGIYKLEAGEALNFIWRSKPFYLGAYLAMSAILIEGNHSFNMPLEVKLFGDQGQLKDKFKLCTSRARRLRNNRSEKLYSIELSGNNEVYELRIGSSVEAVIYG